MRKKLTILVLIHPLLEPPDIVPKSKLIGAPWRTEYYVMSSLRKSGHNVIALKVDNDLTIIEKMIKKHDADTIFNLLEEFNGDPLFDNNIVAHLELLGIPFTGCNSKGLLLAKDKSLAKIILEHHNILTPKFEVAHKNKKFRRPKEMSFPLIVKSKTDEGSYGISQSSVVYNDNKLKERILFIHEHTDSDAIVETFIEGTDLYVSVMGQEHPTTLPPLELSFKKNMGGLKMATNNAKWSHSYQKKHGVKLIQPKNLTVKLLKEISSTCKKIYKTLGLTGYARIDLRVSESGEIYFLEANPNPDIADSDEFALSAKLHGMNYSALLEKIVLKSLAS